MPLAPCAASNPAASNPFCREGTVQLAPLPFEAFRAVVPLEASGTDLSNNVGSADAGVQRDAVEVAVLGGGADLHDAGDCGRWDDRVRDERWRERERVRAHGRGNEKWAPASANPLRRVRTGAVEGDNNSHTLAQPGTRAGCSRSTFEMVRFLRPPTLGWLWRPSCRYPGSRDFGHAVVRRRARARERRQAHQHSPDGERCGSGSVSSVT